MPMTLIRRLVHLPLVRAVNALAAIALLAAGCASTTPRTPVMFDDFTYTDVGQLAGHGWIVRTAPGWPGVPGAQWGPQSFSLHDDAAQPGNRLLRMTSWTDGTPSNTTQSQLCHARKYLEGTYAARVRFTDAPSSGPDGDSVVETFYFISPQKAPMDPDYSEIDFEYLPNGGWGKTGPTMFSTTWETFQLEPWIADNSSTNAARSLEGWHTLVAQVSNGTVRYFVDGKPFAEHGGKFYPEVMMSMNFNLWFVRDALVAGNDMRRYEEDIDWVYFNREVVAPADVDAAVSQLRRRNVRFTDTVPASGLDSPCNF